MRNDRGGDYDLEYFEYGREVLYEGHPTQLYDTDILHEQINYDGMIRNIEDWEFFRAGKPPEDLPHKKMIMTKFPKGIALNFKEDVEAPLNWGQGAIYLNTIWGIATINNNGYLEINQSLKGNTGKKLHRLIYEHVKGKIPQGYEIHHKDGDKLNNSIENLEALTPYEHRQRHMGDG